MRGNNMEGSLLLVYCGGMFHFFRWMEEDGAAAPSMPGSSAATSSSAS